MLTNPVVISVTLLCVLCLVRVNVFLSLLISALVAGLMVGNGVLETINILVDNMGGQANTALAYVLLGAFASAISYTGVADILAVKIAKVVGGKKMVFLFTIAATACFSQNLVPVHIAFIPILIPPLLIVMNKMKLDRRAAACALTFGLKAPYIALPFGFGLIFHGIIAKNMTDNGMNVAVGDVWKSSWVIGASMIIGLVVAIFISYRKEREYKEVEGYAIDLDTVDTTLSAKHYITLAAAVTTLVVSSMTESLPLGAMAGLAIMFITGAIKWVDMDMIMGKGVQLMGFIAFVMLAASGYAGVIKSTGAVTALVDGSMGTIGESKLMGSFVMMVLGLVITMGIGTSFGTVPVIAVLFVPLAHKIGISIPATIVIMAAAAAIGDAGSPASDSTLGPTAGLNADGQHDHIQDTCIPTFLHYNIPIFICGVLAPLFL